MRPRLLDDGAIIAALERLPGWARVGQTLERVVQLPSFEAALAYVNATAEIAARLDHHPDILIQYRTVTLTLSTHDTTTTAGITDLDLDVAAAVSALPQGHLS